MGNLIKYLAILSIAGTSIFFALTLSAEEKAKGRGYCGDGFINGNEDCDGSDIKIRSCKALNGGEGNVKCQPNCVYDISECGIGQQFSDAIDQRVGGLTETCKCTCNNDACDGGCAPIGDMGQGRVDCLFRCDNTCTCNCEGMMESHLEYSNISCKCDIDNHGNPQCLCGIEESEMLVGTSPGIGQLINMTPRFPLALPPVLLPPPPPVLNDIVWPPTNP